MAGGRSGRAAVRVARGTCNLRDLYGPTLFPGKGIEVFSAPFEPVRDIQPEQRYHVFTGLAIHSPAAERSAEKEDGSMGARPFSKRKIRSLSDPHGFFLLFRHSP